MGTGFPLLLGGKAAGTLCSPITPTTISGVKMSGTVPLLPCVPSWLEQGQIYPFYLCLTGRKTRKDSGPSGLRASSKLIRLDVFYNCNFIYVIVQKLASTSHGKFIKTFISSTTYGSQQMIQSVCYHGDGLAHGTAEHSCTVFRPSQAAWDVDRFDMFPD